MPLFNLSDSRNMLNYCDENDVAVLGMEGFKVVGKKEFQIWNVLRISRPWWRRAKGFLAYQESRPGIF